MSSLMERMQKNSILEYTSKIDDSVIFNKNEFTTTSILMMNLALSGEFSGGMSSGALLLAGESKSFKTMFSWIMAKAYLDKYPKAMVVHYDCEFGTPASYLKALGVDTTRVLHCPFKNIEELRFDFVKKLEEIDRKKDDKVMFLIDSIGNAASKKEMDDAIDGKSVADMSRAKQLKSFFRIVTPYLTLKNTPLVAVAHVYKEMGMFPKTIVSGGGGLMLGADAVWIITKKQIKDGKDLMGFDFNINIEKSRFVREKSRFPISVTYKNGVSAFSGLFDLSLELGIIKQVKPGWYATMKVFDEETGEITYKDESYRRAKAELDSDFWADIFKTTPFAKMATDRFKLGSVSLDDVDDMAEKLMSSIKDYSAPLLNSGEDA